MAASNNSMQLEGKTILLGITGGIAAYKSCNIVRLLQKRGARVKVVMSEHATEFVGPLTFRALTNEPVAVGLFDDPSDPIHHISLAQEPDLVVVAPATANIIAKMANGIADDLISTTLLATPRPIVIAPAMNNGMWKAPATQANMATLRDRGVHVVGPGSGYLACGDVDTGRMSEPEDIVEAICEVLNPVPQDLADKRIGGLSGGQQRLLSVALAFVGRPRLVLLDEPSMGLAPQIVEEVFNIVKDLNTKEKVTFLLAEQNTNMALKYADYGYIMESGRVVMDGAASDLASNEDVKEFYLGMGGGERKSFKDVKSYKRRKRWLA